MTATNTETGQSATDTYSIRITRNRPLVTYIRVLGPDFVGEGVHTIEYEVDDTDIYAPTLIEIHRRNNSTGGGHVFLGSPTSTSGEITVPTPNEAGHTGYTV